MVKKNKLQVALPSGRWRVIWFGRLAPLPGAADALGIHTFFLLSGVPSQEQRIERVLVSLAHMPFLHIGAEIDGFTGTISDATPSSRLTKRSVTLDCSLGNTELVNRSSLLATGLTADLARTPQYDSLLVRVKSSAVAVEVFIPCSTLFLFFWCLSSPLLDAAVTGMLLSPERYIYNPDNSDLESNPIRFEVRRRWSDDEAPYLVTLLKEPGALEVGARIYRRIAGARMADPTGLLPLEVWPPFARSLSVTGLFREIGDSLLLTHITSIDLDPNWTALDLYREGGRHVRKLTKFEEPVEVPPKARPSGSSIGPTAEIEVKEAPGGYGHGAADLPAVAGVKSRFPALAEVTVSRPFDSDPVEQGTRKRRRLTGGPWTAITGRPLPTGAAIKGKIVGDETPEPIGNPTEEISDIPTPFDEQLAKFADLLARPVGKIAIGGIESDVQLDFWDPYRGVACASAPAFFELPKTVGQECLTWLYRDPECQRTKRGLCVRVTARDANGSKRARFIIDLERRIPRPLDGATKNAGPISTGLMVVWFDGASSATDTCINLTVVLAYAARTRSPAVRVRPFAGVHIATIRHSDALNKILDNALTAEDECVKSTRRTAESAGAPSGDV